MAGHVSFIPQNSQPRIAIAPSSVPSGYWLHQPLNTRRATSALDGVAPLSPDTAIRNELTQIISHPHFEIWFHCIKQVLQLSSQAWMKYSTFRDDPEARLRLESLYCSIWHLPPEEIWTSLVRLRQEPNFLALQSSISAHIDRAYCHAQHSEVSFQPQEHERNHRLRSSATHSRMDDRLPTSPPVATSEMGMQMLQVHSSTWPEANHPVSQSSLPATIPSPQRARHRQAPDGMMYQCPSEGCSRTYTRLGHYIKHLKKQHPDFGPQHPYHSPHMSLRPRTLSNSTHPRPSSGVRFEDQYITARSHERRSSRTFPNSRRDSFVSVSSLNSIGMSSSAVDDSLEDSFVCPSNDTGFDPIIPQDSHIWHVGGGTAIDEADVNGGEEYYGGMDDSRKFG